MICYANLTSILVFFPHKQLLGAVLGWGILSPLAKYKGWAPGDIGDWENGSKGWIVWTSLAIMLADAVVSLGYLATRPLLQRMATASGSVYHKLLQHHHLLPETRLGRLFPSPDRQGYRTLRHEDNDDDNNNTATISTSVPASPLSEFSGHHRDSTTSSRPNNNNNNNDENDNTSHHHPLQASKDDNKDDDDDDAPPSQLISTRTVLVGLVLSIAFCVLCIHTVFGALVPLYATIAAVLMALVLSIMGVRALGETDLNPVSGISKLAQLFFALIVPQGHPTSVLINLVAGAVSEAGALQAGDLMQDLKTGHLLGAAPKAQFWGQVLGATVGAVVSALIYRLYTAVYPIPGRLFQVPTAYVWIFTARLVTGQGLPYMAREWATAFAVLFAVTTMARLYAGASSGGSAGRIKWWQNYVPGGIAVAVGMYNVPSFTLARTVGGLGAWAWRRQGRAETPLIVLASGFILGEGFLSIVNLLMESAGVPHL